MKKLFPPLLNLVFKKHDCYSENGKRKQRVWHHGEFCNGDKLVILGSVTNWLNLFAEYQRAAVCVSLAIHRKKSAQTFILSNFH